MYFDQGTDRGRSSQPARAKTAGNRAYVDALFGFSFPLGIDYMGEWEDDSTFLVTIVNTISAPMERPYRVDIQDVIACAGQPPESCAVAQIPMDHQLDVLAPFLPAEAAATLQALRLGDDMDLVSVAEFKAAFETVHVTVRREVRDAP